jgi:hypothetical protein
LLTLLGAFAAPCTATASVLDRVQVGGVSPATTKFSPALSIALPSPAPYATRCCNAVVSGVWFGPTWVATGNPARSGPSSIEWSASFGAGTSLETSARGVLWQGWPQVSAGPVSVPHVVSGRRVGTVPGFAVTAAEPAPGARHQAALALSLGRGVHARVLFDVVAPFSDSAGAHGEFVVAAMRPSAWNRTQAAAALAGVFLEASLPPARVTARVAGRRITGAVRDSFGHPVAEVAVRLERKTARGWKRVRSGTSSLRGTFALRASAKGRYRVVATLATASARSGVVLVRR